MKGKARSRVRPERMIGDTSTPVFLVSPDRRIAFFNLGCETLTGWPAADVVGQLCEYGVGAEGERVEALAASLCPPASAFEGRIVSAPIAVACRGGEPLPRLVNFLPLADEAGKVTAVMGVIVAPDSQGNLVEPTPAQELHAELATLRFALSRRFGSHSLVCRGDAMLRVAEQVSIARSTTASVLIFGEAGSGKEHMARSIHYESQRRTRSFVPLDCRQISALEIEQTLRRLLHPSRDDDQPLSSAALLPGTLFLSHVERLPRDAQKLIVDAFRGGRDPQSDLRLIASTLVEPAALEGECLRPDFFHLLTPLCISVPPLRCRADDLRFLAQHLLEELNRGEARQLNGFAEDVWGKFSDYNWPGNVDELLTVIREARAVCDGPLIRAKDLPFRFRTGLDAQSVGPAQRPQVAPLEPYLAQAEKVQIEEALRQCRHNKSKAAQLLGLTRPRLYRRMEVLGISDEPEAG